MACFHCGGPVRAGAVRFAFCSVACEALHADRYERFERGTVDALLAECAAAAPLVPPFKTLLARRALIAAQRDREGGTACEQLLAHAAHHAMERPAYCTDARRVADLLASRDDPALRGGAGDDDDQGAAAAVEERCARYLQLLLAIDVNALALGDYSVGLAPRLASFFDHDCAESVTHYCEWRESSPTLVFRAVTPRAAQQPLTICYLGEASLKVSSRHTQKARSRLAIL